MTGCIAGEQNYSLLTAWTDFGAARGSLDSRKSLGISVRLRTIRRYSWDCGSNETETCRPL